MSWTNNAAAEKIGGRPPPTGRIVSAGDFKRLKRCLVIQLDSEDDVRDAILQGQCKFEFTGRRPQPRPDETR